MENVAQKIEKSIPGAIKIDEKEVFDHLDTLVRQSVEDTINSLLDAEADAICNANRYQRSPDRLDTRAGSYKRKLLTKAGEVIGAILCMFFIDNRLLGKLFSFVFPLDKLDYGWYVTCGVYVINKVGRTFSPGENGKKKKII